MYKRKTHEEYVAELAIKNPTVEVVGKYVDSYTKILHHCLIHDVYWDVLPPNALKGKGCKECMKEKNRNRFIKSHEDYVLQLKEVNPDIIVLEKYLGGDVPILHLCKKHNVKWMAYPNNILKGQGCIECGKDKYHDKRCKKHEDYVKELTIKNPTVEVIEEYIDSHTPILHRCLVHDTYWDLQPANALRGDGCWKCRNEKLRDILIKTHEDYMQELSIKNPNVEVIGRYMGHQIKTLHHCLIHDEYWETIPSNALKGCGCRKCLGEKISEKCCKTHEQYVKDVEEINPDVEVVGQYINAKTPILHKCKIDGYEWMAIPFIILAGYGCPQCNESSGERQVRQWLNKHNIKYEYQKPFKDCRDILPLPFDFYLPDFNIAIEYQGGQHYKPVERFGGEEKFKLQQKHDNIKRQYCKNNNIKLLEIPYFKNVEEELNNFLFI